MFPSSFSAQAVRTVSGLLAVQIVCVIGVEACLFAANARPINTLLADFRWSCCLQQKRVVLQCVG
jgi:hypothetical protein